MTDQQRIAEIEALEALRNLHINDTHKGMKLSVVLTHAAVAIHEQAAKDAEIERLREAQRWIPVTERLPDNTKDDWVLAQITETNGYKWIPEVMEYRERTGDWYCDKIGWLKDHKDSFVVTHWMPLPAAPEEGAEK